MQAGQEIIKQLGGNKFIVTTGATNFGFDAAKNYLQFKIGRGAKNGITHVTITLNSMDLYDMEFLKCTVKERTVKGSAKNIYADMLQSEFTRHTGFDTRL